MSKLSIFIIGLLIVVTFLNQSCSKESPEKFILSVDVSPDEGGSVNPSLGTFELGTKLSISANPAVGYEFQKWVGDISKTTNPLEYTIVGDTKITAIFVKADTDGDGVSNDIDECPNTPKGESVNQFGCAETQIDTDGDGINDNLDLCQETPVGETVDENGCSDSQKDSDSDGIIDDIDECPNSGEGEVVDETGCSDNQRDSDNDGVFDDRDECPNTPSGESVVENGCSNSQKDSDGDGVTDDLDQCSNTPSGESVNEYGCSDSETDGDGDGVTNDLDECPNTPNGENVDSKGCSDSQKDSDGDGINDYIDKCPNTPASQDVNPQGCSPSQRDSDADGVVDSDDQCSNTPTGETVDGNGCSQSQKDSDGDGISDYQDQCPNTSASEDVDDFGCSISQIDSDEDGVNNDIDQCPDTPIGETVDVNGCSDSQKDTDGDGVNDSIDTCPDTPDGEIVDESGCSDSQTDNDAPTITDVTVTNILSTSFTVNWSLDEGSKGYIRFGTSSGTYLASTSIENNYLTNHVQTVGGNNPFPLNPGTTYFWQIYVEDQYGNAGFSVEQETTLLSGDSDDDGVIDDLDLCPDTKPGRTVDNNGCPLTYVPDDGFENLLINLGYDNVLDDYVKKSNIESVTSLEFIGEFTGPFLAVDLTGIEDFESLNALEFNTGFQATYIQVSSFDKVKIEQLNRLVLNGVELQEPLLIKNTNLTSLDLKVKTNYIEISNNPGLSFAGGRLEAISVLISNNPNITSVDFLDSNLDSATITNNDSLQAIITAGDFNIITQVLISNNDNLTQIISDLAPMQVSLLEIENNPSITRMIIDNPNPTGGLSSIDLSGLPNLEQLELYSHALTFLDVSNNNKLLTLGIAGNPLTCIQVNQTQLSNIPAGWVIDAEDSYSLDCN